MSMAVADVRRPWLASIPASVRYRRTNSSPICLPSIRIPQDSVSDKQRALPDVFWSMFLDDLNEKFYWIYL